MRTTNRGTSTAKSDQVTNPSSRAKVSTAGGLKVRSKYKTPGVVEHPEGQKARLSGEYKTKGIVEHPVAFHRRNPNIKLRRFMQGGVERALIVRSLRKP